MYKVTKRNGVQMDFNPNKIQTRIKKQADNLKVNTDEIFIKVTQGIFDGITTRQLDELISQTAESISYLHPDYSKLAANIAISRHHKETEESYIKVIKKLKNENVISLSFYEKVKENLDIITKTIDYSRDYIFDYFAWTRLKEIYLLKIKEDIIERPQHMYMRVALSVTNNIEDAMKYYDKVSQHLISPATPIMINAGTTVGQYASCNLNMCKGDDTEGLLNTFNNICISSSKAEGIGLAMHNIRSKESYVGSGSGKAGGLLKYLKIVNEGLRFWNQKGKRPGSCAIYLEPWHKDVFDFIDIRKNTGSEELRARDLFTALWVPDNFMRAVETDGDWYLFCPNDIQKAGLKPLWDTYGEEYEEIYNKAVELGLGKKVKAQEIWVKVLNSQTETGIPYLLYKDNINKKSNHQNIGTIKSSNLCLDGDTLVNVKINGKKETKTLKEVNDLFNSYIGINIKVESYDIENGINEYQSITNSALMNPDAEVYEVTDLTTNKTIIVTENHLVYTKNGGYIPVKLLSEEDVLLSLGETVSFNSTSTVKIKKLEKTIPVYDVTVEKNENFFANGILVHNCAEIVQYTDENTTAICTLSSLPLQNYIVDGKYDFEKLKDSVSMIVKSLNVVIDINDYSTAEGRKGGEEQRAIGIGVQGLADTFAILNYNFTSQEAKELNKVIFETIYYAALRESCNIAKDTGVKYKYFEGSPFSEGKLQFHFWGLNEDDLSGMWDWKGLIEDIKQYGVSNSMLTAIMPTASSASVIGSNEAIEPFNSNIYLRKVIGGEYFILNKHLVKDLEKEGVWNKYVANEILKDGGSVQNIPVISDELKEKYKTAYELKGKDLLTMSIDRSPFIDQTQSQNLFMATPTVGTLTSSHFYAWKNGLKTAQYYLRTDAVEMKAKHLGVELNKDENIKTSNGNFDCYGCSS